MKNYTYENADYYENLNSNQFYQTIEEALEDDETTKKELVAIHSKLLIGDYHGQYIPQFFVQNFDLKSWNLISFNSDIESIRKGPECEWYWEAWNILLSNAFLIDEDGNKWVLEQDGDLFTCLYINFEEE